VRDQLRDTRIAFVHSGGWKKMQAESVGRDEFEHALLSRVAPGSTVLDYYGLVEQIGVVYPLCSGGVRHVPRWAHVIVRDPWSLEPTDEGLLQLLNPMPKGAPYHSVLTEDVGRLVDGDCSCGRRAPAFELIGRVPQAEVRGCGDA
jgi:hypothetical protein